MAARHTPFDRKTHLAHALAGAVLVATGFAGCYDAPLGQAARVMCDPLELPPVIRRTTPTTVNVDLVTKEIIADVGADRPTLVWTFNGKIPGPLIRVMEGDTVVLRLTNEAGSREPHSIDLHAVVGPGGGHAVTEVAPGKTAELRFKATRQGAYIYHCAAEGMPWEHLAYGMYGAILVEPPGGIPSVDRELYVVQSEWYLGRGGGEEHEEEGSSAHAPMPKDVLVLDEAAASTEHPLLFSWNGHKSALTDAAFFGERMRVPQGGRVRVVFGNAGPNLPSSFHVIGAIFDQVFTGHFGTPLRNEETVLVPPGSAAVFEFDALVPGVYTMVDHALFRVPKGAVGNLHVDPKGTFPSDLYAPKPSGPMAGAHGTP